jgi:hypothetical protein
LIFVFFSPSPFLSLSFGTDLVQGFIHPQSFIHLFSPFFYSMNGPCWWLFYKGGGDRTGLDLEKFRELNPPFSPSLSLHSEHYFFLCLVFGYWMAYAYGYGCGLRRVAI